jgi:hypothetical protein
MSKCLFFCFTQGDRPGNSLLSQSGSEEKAAEMLYVHFPHLTS